MRGELARRGIQSTAATVGMLLGEAAGAPAPVGLVTAVAGKALAAAGAPSLLGALWLFMTTKFIIGLLVGGALSHPAQADAQPPFLLQPGDIIFVPERIL